MDLHLYIDTQARKFVRGPQDKGAFTFPNLFQGDTLNLFLHGVTPNTDPDSLDVYQENPIVFTGIKCGIGLGADILPSAGTFKIRLVGQTETTVAFDCDAGQDVVLAAVNALPTVQAVSLAGHPARLAPAGRAEHFSSSGGWTPTITALFEIVGNYLEPLSFTRSRVQALSLGQIQVLKYFVAPYCFTDVFAYPSPTAVTTGSVRLGSTTQNCVQGVNVPADGMGSFSLTFANNTTTLLSVADYNGTTDGSTDLAAALNALYSDGQTRFAVTRYANGVYYIEFLGPLAKTDYPVMAVTMSGQEPLDTPAGSVPLGGGDLEVALHGQAQLKGLVFELEITNGSDVFTIQQTVTVVNDMIDGGMSLVASPPWQTPTDPSYPPNQGGGQVIVAPGAYIQPIGTGSGVTSATVVITHNLGTQNVLVGVRQTAAPFLRVPDNGYTCTILNDTQVEIVFPAAPTAVLQYYVVIAAVIPAAQAFPNLQITIDQVTGLRVILNELLNGINPDAPVSDNELPTHISWYNKDAEGNQTTLRFDIIPDALIPTNIPRLDGNGDLPADELPPGVPYYVPGPPPMIVVTVPGPPPQTIPILVGDPTQNPPVWTLPISILPDPTDWPGLLLAIIKALQGGAPIPKGYVPMNITPLVENFPAPVVIREGVAAVPASLPTSWTNFVDGGVFSGALPLPDATLAGRYLRVVDGASSDAVQWRPAQNFFDGTTILCDGQQWFEVRTEGNVAYPVEMERELFTIHVSSAMMPKGSRFACSAELYIALLGACAKTTRGRYLLRVQVGSIDGPNLHDITFGETVLELPLILGSTSVGHTFGFSVLNSAAGAITATQTMYGNDTPVPNFVLTDFVVRAVLVCFDLEDVTNNHSGAAPVGQVDVKVTNPVASVALIPAS